MLCRFSIDVMGVKAGAIKSLPDGLASRLIAKGVLEVVSEASSKKADKDTAKVFKTAKTGGKRAKK